MNVILKLPLPDIICMKIFNYTNKSPHSKLCLGILNKKLKGRMINNINNDDNLTCINRKRIVNYPESIFIDLYYFSNFCNLKTLVLSWTNVYGNISVLNVLSNLILLDLEYTNISGNISSIVSNKNLNTIILSNTRITGDVIHFSKLPKLQNICVCNTFLYGNLIHFKNLLNFELCNLNNTKVEGDIVHLSHLVNLTRIFIEYGYDRIYGNVMNIILLPKIIDYNFSSTKVTGGPLSSSHNSLFEWVGKY